MTDLELLAPARNTDIGIAAIDCGADAVYLAGPEFGARKAAVNSVAEIRRLCDYAHRFGVRIFITLNTILFDDELTEAQKLLDEAKDAGIDAVIAQDLAVTTMTDLPLHASTQCAIRTPGKARFYESLGFSRLVLEREMSLDQIKAVRDAVGCELECFVHGALCVCFSGQCYMSESIAGRSANRGECVQACRSLYDLVDESGNVLVRNKALLSLKDYKLRGRLEDLAEAGVNSFKIEGRLKNISYVRNVVRAYSIALDNLAARHPDKYRRASFGRVSGGFAPDLDKTFNRGYTKLFFDGTRGLWSSMDAPKSMGEEIGTVVSVSTRKASPRYDGACLYDDSSCRSKASPRYDGACLYDDSSCRSKASPRYDGACLYDDSSCRTKASPRYDGAAKKTSKTLSEKAGISNFCGGSGPFTEDILISVKLKDSSTVLRNGDGFAFVGRDRNEIIGFRGNVCQGDCISCSPVSGIFSGARLFRNLDGGFEKEIEGNLPSRFIPVDVSIVVCDKNDEKCLMVNAVSQDGRVVEMERNAGSVVAENLMRMKAMFSTQISKSTEKYSFTLTSLSVKTLDGKLPFLPAQTLNSIRRDIAAKLDEMPCKAIPLQTGRNPAAHLDDTSDGLAQDYAGYGPAAESAATIQSDEDLLPDKSEKIPFEEINDEAESLHSPSSTSASNSLSYKANVSNHIARKIYEAFGAKSIEDAFEITHRQDVELMRTKYCIRYELGLCPVRQKRPSTHCQKPSYSNTHPTSGASPLPASGASPLPASGASPLPASGASPLPASGASPLPASGASLLPASGASPLPASGASTGRRLFLLNNGKRYSLTFDCLRCEMTVSEA